MMLRDHCERLTVVDQHDVPVGELSLLKLVKEAFQAQEKSRDI